MSKKRILITGFSGFVAYHFLEFLVNYQIDWEVYGIDVNRPKYNLQLYEGKMPIRFFTLDMTDRDSLIALFRQISPDYILHLAAFSSVAYSWKHPAESYLNNSNIFLNLIEAVKEYCPYCRILSIGSSEEYGNVDRDKLPIREDQNLNPLSPYAVARVSQEMLSRIFCTSFNMDIVMTRSFNHIGPGQDTRFVVPSFVKRIMDIKAGGYLRGTIETGDITVIRDFVDVRDVVRAYYLLLLQGKRGEAYNICSGRAVCLHDLIQIIAQQVGVKVETQINPDFIRPQDNRIVVGSPFKIESELGWHPEIGLQQTITDMIADIGRN